MVQCIVSGCSKKSGRDKDVSFHRLPKIVRKRGATILELSARRRAGYLKAIGRSDITETVSSQDNYRICSRHFVSEKPAALEDSLSPDWLPTIHLGRHGASAILAENRVREAKERWERKLAREESVARGEAAKALISIGNIMPDSVSEEQAKKDVGVQTDVSSKLISLLHTELNDAYSKIYLLEQRLKLSTPFCESYMETNDQFVAYYTGLPNYQVLKLVFDLVAPPSSTIHERSTKLTSFQQFMVVMVKLRLDTGLQDLAYRFGVSLSTVSRTILKWLTLMDVRLRPLLLWPDREDLRKSMPMCFQASFGTKVAIIIDCFEVFIERPSNLLARASTWSSYKHHNTVKVLLGITPQGVVSFISDAWGGRVSDKHLTEHSGLLNKLLPGDVVLADRGFDISESVGMMQARLHIPAFTKGKNQLSALEVEETRSIANVRIHVERVIGTVRQKYSILEGTIPIDFVTKRSGADCPLVDCIVRVCCALYNLCDPIVPKD